MPIDNLGLTLDSSARPATPYSSFEAKLAALSPDDMRAMLRSIFMDFYPEGVDEPEWDSETHENVTATFWCMGFTPPLKAEQNTPEMHERIEAAFEVSPFWADAEAEDGITSNAESFELFFEHGQWWVRVELEVDEPDVNGNPSGTRTYSVVDASPGIDGFGFEEV